MHSGGARLSQGILVRDSDALGAHYAGISFLFAVIPALVISSFEPPTVSSILVGEEIEIALSPSTFILNTASPARICTEYGVSSVIPLGSSCVCITMWFSSFWDRTI